MAQEPWDRFLSSRFNIHTMMLMLMILTCSVGRVFFSFFFSGSHPARAHTQLFDSPNEEEEEEEEEGMGGDRV